jgi:PAS domain S-box-containing protein
VVFGSKNLFVQRKDREGRPVSAPAEVEKEYPSCHTLFAPGNSGTAMKTKNALPNQWASRDAKAGGRPGRRPSHGSSRTRSGKQPPTPASARQEDAVPDSRFQLIADALPELIAFVDSHRRYQFNNKAYEAWFGVSREELKGRTVREVIGAADYEKVRPYIRRALAGQRSSFEGPIAYKKAAVERYVQIDYVPVSQRDGRIVGFYVLITDLTKPREAATLAERNRMAGEVHDTVAQDLAGIALRLEIAEEACARESGEALEHIARARELARSTLGEIRRSLLTLSPSQTETGDLADSIRGLLDRLRPETAIRLEFSVSGTPRRIKAAIEENLFRIAQQAVANALQHSAAAVIRVALRFGGRALRLRVSDDGRGFVVSAARGGFGLRSMRERARKLGGKLTIASRRGKGTLVEADVPLPQLPRRLSAP